MSRLAITKASLIALFAKSGNVCAFPGCNHELVTARSVFVGQLCHIEAANPGGQRYNPDSTDNERRSADNLILLCYRHHKETDDINAFDTLTLRAIKLRHESAYAQKPFKVNEAFLHKLEAEMQVYWNDIENANKNHHVTQKFAVTLRLGTSAPTQFVDLEKSVQLLTEVLNTIAASDATLNDEIRHHLEALGYDLSEYDKVPYYKNPFFNRNWETHSLLVNNTLTDLVVALKHAEVRFLEEYVKTHSNELDAMERIDVAKAELHAMATSLGYAD